MRKVLGRTMRALVSVETSIRMKALGMRLSHLGRLAKVASTSKIYGHRGVEIGARTAIGDFVHIWGGGGVRIGDDTLIAAHTVIASESHDVQALSIGKLYRETATKAAVAIGSNVWIASSVVIGPGISIGDNSIVAAGSVVLSNVPAGVLVAGVPARIVRSL